MELSGTWRAVEADEALRREFAEPGLDDAAWEPIVVPGHWRSTAAFAASDGPVLYRRTFEAPAPDPGRRAWLVFDGAFYQTDVWLDGSYVGDTEGYFVRHTFEVSEALRARAEHTLAVEVVCAPQVDRTAKRNLTGVLQHWDCLDPDWNPGGIWRPVRIEETGPVRIRTLRVLCRDATEGAAVIALRADLDTDAARTVGLHTVVTRHDPSGAAGVAAADDRTERVLAQGENWVEWEVTVPEPALWWPRALGGQPLYDVTVAAVLPDQGGAVSHTRARRTGLRRLHWRDWTLEVNGERMFLKGSNHGPTRMALAEATADELRRDVQLAVDANLDLLRVHAHVTRPELYDAADEAGLLLWQDMPLQWGYARGVRKQAVRQARVAVEQLGHHPSIVVWCGHNESLALDVEPGLAGVDVARVAVTFATGQFLPTWNKDVLDRSIARALSRADGTRLVVPHSGALPHLTSGGTDTHVYLGWYLGDERDFPALCRTIPRMARFVSEFGAQAVPVNAGFCEPDRWPDLDWARLGRTHALQKQIFDRYVPPADHATFDAWRAATQAYQATVIKHHVEHLRRLKYRPTGGFCQFCFADGHPAVTWSVLDHERAPKAGYGALAAACAPVIVVADRLPAVVRPGDELGVDVHVVSDLRRPLDQARVRARLAWATGHREWAWAGAVPADACEHVGRVEAVVPDEAGPLRLELALEADGGVRATNSYETTVAGKSPPSGRAN